MNKETFSQTSNQNSAENFIQNRTGRESELLIERQEGRSSQENKDTAGNQVTPSELRERDKVFVEKQIKNIRNDLSLLAADIETNTNQQQGVHKSNQEVIKKEVQTGHSLLSRIKNNKFLRRLVYGSVFVGGMLSSEEAFSQNDIDINNKETTDYVVDKAENSFINDQENNKEKIKSEFFELFYKMKQHHAQYPDFMVKWKPSDYSSQYYSREMSIHQVDDLGNIVGEKPMPYDVMFTVNDDEKNKIKNFDISSLREGVATQIRYNEMLTGPDIIVLQYCYKNKSGFKKMTAREFEQEYKIIDTRPGVRANMDRNYVWVNTDLDNEKLLNEVLSNFNHPSVYSEYNNEDVEPSVKE